MHAAVWLVIALAALNVVSTLMECGLGACPDNPLAHELLNAHREAGAYAYSMIFGHGSALIFHLETDDIPAEVARLEKLGAEVVDRLERWVVMQAPTGRASIIRGARRIVAVGRSAAARARASRVASAGSARGGGRTEARRCC